MKNINYLAYSLSVGIAGLLILVACQAHRGAVVQSPEVVAASVNADLPAFLDTLMPEVKWITIEGEIEPGTSPLRRPDLPVYTFSSAEKANVRVADKRLFAESSKMTIDLCEAVNQEFVFPLAGAKIISDYGSRGRSHHSGVDIKTRAGDTIRAAFSGTVRMSCPYGAYGNVIVIRHPNGLETVYSHNVKNIANVGDAVSAGDIIAFVGRTGRASTEHLHFEVRINGQAISPHLLIDFKAYALKEQALLVSKNGSGVSVQVKKSKAGSYMGSTS